MRKSIPDEDLLDTIGLIYHSALDPSGWPAALQAMSRHVDGCSGFISVQNPEARSIRFATEWNGLKDWDVWGKLFRETYAARMPFYSVLPKCEIGAVYDTAQLAAMIGRSHDIYEDPFFTEWALPAGLRDNLSSVLMKSHNRFALFALHTATTRDLVTPEELALCARLVPHVRRAVTIGDLLDMTVGAANTLKSTLDKLSAAVIVTDKNARVVMCNAAGEEVLHAADPLSLEEGHVRAREPQTTKALQAAIAQTGDPLNALGGNGIGIPLKLLDGRPGIAHVLPLGFGPKQGGWRTNAAAAIFISPVDQAVPAADALIALYGLTNMEARVLMQIAAGANRGEVAVSLGVADSTIKTHLQRIFGKTGARDQAELSKLIASLSSPARGS